MNLFVCEFCPLLGKSKVGFEQNVHLRWTVVKTLFQCQWLERFYWWKFKPKSASSILQALSCRFCQLKLRNWVIQVNSWFPTNGNQGSLCLYKMPGGFFSDRSLGQKPVPFALPQTRSTLFGKIPEGIFIHKQILKARNTQISKLQPKNRQDRACRIELADLSLNFPRAKSVLPLA